MKNITRDDLRKAFLIIDGEMERLSFLMTGENYIIPASVGAKILGISMQAMEERLQNHSFKIFNSFGKRYLEGQMIRDLFRERVETLLIHFDSLNKLQTSSLKKIVDYADSLKNQIVSYPPD